MSARIVGAIGAPRQHPVAPILERPIGLSERHWAELRASAIPADLAGLSFRSFGEGFADAAREREALLYEAKAQAGHQPGHAYQRLIRLDARYAYLLEGGWRFVGDALPGFEAFHCWKPDSPQPGTDGRIVKYLHPEKASLGVLLPQVSRRVWALVAERSGVPMPVDCSGGFWEWAMATPEVSLILTEGAKKTAALLGIGYAAIGLPGIETGRRVPEVEGVKRRDLAHLVPELQALAAQGRRFVVAFDRDSAKPETMRKVEAAACRLGHLLAAANCEVGIARIPELFGAPKTGADDLIAAGLEADLEAALDQPLGLGEVAWELRLERERRWKPTLTLNARRLMSCSQLAKPPAAPIVAIRSAKASGKTELQLQWLAGEQEVVALTHRRSLGTSLAGRLGLQWRNDLDGEGGRSFNEATGECWEGLPPRLALCVDSLLALGDPAKYANAVLVIDEAQQVIGHLLTSTTSNCAEHRGALLQRLQGLIRHCKRIVLLDADLADAELKWVQQAREGAEVALIVNEATPAPWPVTWWEHSTPEAIQQALLAAVKAGERPLVVTDSRRAATALNHLLEAETGHAGLLVTKDTVELAEVQALLPRLNDAETVEGLSWLVASPSISSGVSVEHNGFTSVWGLFFGGSLDDAEILQALARVRPQVTRNVWVTKASSAHNRVSNAWWPKQVEADLRRRWDNEAELMRRALTPDLLAGIPLEVVEGFNATVELWAAYTARRNFAHAHLRAFVLARLRHEAHAIAFHAEPIDEAEAQALRTLKKELKANRDEAAAIAITQAPILTTGEAAALQRRQFKTATQQASLQRRAICERLALPPEQLTPELLEWGQRWSSAARRLLMVLEPDRAAATDLEQLKTTTNEGVLLPWDQGLRLERSKWAEGIGLTAFVGRFCQTDGPAWSASTPEVVELAKLATGVKYRQQVTNAFGVNVTAKADPVKLIGSMLRTMGITTVATRHTDGSRSYRPDPQQLQTLQKALDRLRQQPLRHLHTSQFPLIQTEPMEVEDSPPSPPVADAGGWPEPDADASMRLDEQLDLAALSTSHQLPGPAVGAPSCRSSAPTGHRHQPCTGLDRSWTRRAPRSV